MFDNSEFTYSLQNSGISVLVSKKRIRSFRLRVGRDGNVLCSVPWLSSKAKAIEFIESKSDWIQMSVKKVKSALQKSETLREDSKARLLGLTERDFLSEKTDSAENCPKNERIYSKKWKTCAEKVFSETLFRFHSQIFSTELGKKIPEISKITLKCRKMKSMWGNCNRRTNTITLNYELLRFPQGCIDYVVLHELVHFVYIYHDKNFYSTVERFMTDYKARVLEMKKG